MPLNPKDGPQKQALETPFSVPLTPCGVLGRRTEGTLLLTQVKRKTKKSAFLKKLERRQAQPTNVVDIKSAKKTS